MSLFNQTVLPPSTGPESPEGAKISPFPRTVPSGHPYLEICECE